MTVGSVSGRQDLNLRPPAPKAGALAKLSYAPVVLVLRTGVVLLPLRGAWLASSAKSASASLTEFVGRVLFTATTPAKER